MPAIERGKARNSWAAKENTYYALVAGNDHMAFIYASLLQCRFSRDLAPGTDHRDRALQAEQLTRSLVNEVVEKQQRLSGRTPDIIVSTMHTLPRPSIRSLSVLVLALVRLLVFSLLHHEHDEIVQT
jgi:hypothetical protein